MAVSLGLLGRGAPTRAVRYWLVHVAAAAAAGALVGALFGGVGALLGLAAWRPWILALVALAALALGLRHEFHLGTRQVPRRWKAGTPIAWIFAIWGAMLGCGLYTPVYHTAFFVLTGAQLTAGPLLAALAGALFGGVRQATALYPALARYDEGRTMALLERFRPAAWRLNVALSGLGGLVLALLGRT
ncbi:MAG TPA: hypothetical protein VFI22_07225 [Thermomicrobiales bacterium]|nr:hypothetical protein [Thermomicrobiales bacterium]